MTSLFRTLKVVARVLAPQTFHSNCNSLSCGTGALSMAVLAVGACLSGCLVEPRIEILNTAALHCETVLSDSSLSRPGMWGAHDLDVLLPCKNQDAWFRVVSQPGVEWILSTYDRSGKLVSKATFPSPCPIQRPRLYALDEKLQRIAYCTSFGEIEVRNLTGLRETLFTGRFADSYLDIG